MGANSKIEWTDHTFNPWIGCEPLIGPVDLTQISVAIPDELERHLLFPLSGYRAGFNEPVPMDSKIDWVICGGESGPNARPMHPAWARSLRDQCQAAGVPFLFKQWGEWGPATYHAARGCDHEMLPTFQTDAYEIVALSKDNFIEDGMLGRVGKKRAGRLLDGREWSEFPTAGISGQVGFQRLEGG